MISKLLQERPSLGVQIVTQYLCYAVVLAMAFKVPWKLGLKNWEWFTSYISFNIYLFFLHGMLTFGLMWLCQPRNLTMIFGDDLDSLAILQCGMISLLAIVLWDFGVVRPFEKNLPIFILLNCHHIGPFLAMFFGAGWRVDALVDTDKSLRWNLENQASLDTCIFGWLWMSHSLKILLEFTLPYIFGIKLVKGARSLPIDVIKHVYALGTVYFCHRYINYNLDKFFTYQTSSLLVMLLGRYMANGNWKNIVYMRRIEFPGFVIVVVDRVLGFHDNFCQHSLTLMVCLCVIYLVYNIIFGRLTQVPVRFFNPEDNTELKKFLEEETDAVLGVSETVEKISAAKTKWVPMSGLIFKWWDGQEFEDGTKWAHKYPVHFALLHLPGNRENVNNFINLLDKIGEKALDQPMTDLKDNVPLVLCSYQYNYEYILILLKRGADPYIKNKDDRTPIQIGLKDPWKLSATGKPGALGFSDGFWERFNAICLKKSPSKVLSRQEKFYDIVKQF